MIAYPSQEWTNYGCTVLQQSLSKHTTTFTEVSYVHSVGWGVCFIPQLTAHCTSHQSPVIGVSLNCIERTLESDLYIYYFFSPFTGENLCLELEKDADYRLLRSFSSCLLIWKSRIVHVKNYNSSCKSLQYIFLK